MAERTIFEQILLRKKKVHLRNGTMCKNNLATPLNPCSVHMKLIFNCYWRKGGKDYETKKNNLTAKSVCISLRCQRLLRN